MNRIKQGVYVDTPKRNHIYYTYNGIKVRFLKEVPGFQNWLCRMVEEAKAGLDPIDTDILTGSLFKNPPPVDHVHDPNWI